MKKIGYYSAKEFINKKFGREVYTDEILLTWIGIKQPKNLIIEASKEGIENAYKKADEINEKIGDIVIKKEMVDKWVKENKLVKENNNEQLEKDDEER